ncbi:MAG: sensor histidine kinase [Bacteroidota bacterium]
MKVFLVIVFYVFISMFVCKNTVFCTANDTIIIREKANLKISKCICKTDTIDAANFHLLINRSICAYSTAADSNYSIGVFQSEKNQIVASIISFKKAVCEYQLLSKNKTHYISIVGTKGLIATYSRLGNLFFKLGDFIIAQIYYERVLESIKSNYKLFDKTSLYINITSCLNLIGNCYASESNYNKSITYFKSAIKLFDYLGLNPIMQKELQKLYYNIGIAYICKGEYSNAYYYLYKSIKLLEGKKDNSSIALVYSNLGALFFKQDDYSNGLNCFVKSYSIYKKLNNLQKISECYNSIASAFSKRGEIRKAIIWYEKSLAISSTINYKQASSVSYYNIGAIYKNQQNYNKALESFTIALMQNIAFDNKYGISLINCNIADIYNKKKDYKKALTFGLKSLTQNKSLGAQLKEYTIYNVLKETYFGLGEYKKAFQYGELYLSANDSTFNQIKAKTIAETTAKYQIEKHAKEIDLLKRENEIKKYEIKQQNAKVYSLIGLSLFIIVLFIVFYFLIRAKQKENFNKELLDQQNKGLIAISESQERERVRIARELHDGVGQLLAGVKINLSSFRPQFDDISQKERDAYLNTIKLIDEACTEVRVVSHQMIPKSLTNSGIANAVEELLGNVLKPAGIMFSFDLHNIPKLPEFIEFQLYRIIQEIINNVIKHASASFVSIQLLKNNAALVLIVEDNGVGYDKMKVKDGIGLLNILSRVSSLNGNFSIEPSPGNGTIVTIRIPIIINE